MMGELLIALATVLSSNFVVVIESRVYDQGYLNTKQYNIIQYKTIQNSKIQYSTVQYNSTQSKVIQYNTVLYDKIQHNILC